MSLDDQPTSWLIDQDKITKYLLNLTHRSGGPKPRFFLAFGFAIERPQILAHALASHPILNPPGRERTMPLGYPRLVFEGPLETPDGRAPQIRTVWQCEHPTEARFLTAVPLTR
ncbi:DUF6883 domain-containing protein [Methylobacterium sp. Leaf112]|uniref:DUF6883 domain-containing protein n=1 Tax=Methylobacterium sp. Leaf112 TaxID=1736258 RepID=UPI0006FA9367|nr:DUF6883 domain-containing protein [Methylobacterium sp. Leaf112]KQP60408.1 hypothetical protein ASF52_08745 [Methylobacterium sp. Leaf112]